MYPHFMVVPYLCVLEEEHNRVDRIIPSSEARQENPVEVELEDGEGNMDKEFVSGGS